MTIYGSILQKKKDKKQKEMAGVNNKMSMQKYKKINSNNPLYFGKMLL